MKTELTKYFLLDTNILVHAINPVDDFKHEIANELFEGLISGEEELALTTQVISETFNVFIKSKELGADLSDVYSILSEIVGISAIPKLVVTPQIALKAFNLHLQFDVDFYDALIVATMKENGITTIYTEDKDFQKIEGITVINPFAKTI